MTPTDANLDHNPPAVMRAFIQTKEFREGCLTVELDTKDKPLHARGFAQTILNVCELLESQAIEGMDWALIEAAIVGSHAAITFRAYAKEAFGKVEQ